MSESDGADMADAAVALGSRGGALDGCSDREIAGRDDADRNLADRDIIERSFTEPELFALLFQRHAERIGGYVTRRLGRDLAEDLVAETFLVAFRRRASYDLTRADARPWLHGIAANLIRKYYRAEERQLRAFERTGVDPVAESAGELAEARLAASEASRSIAGALARLNPDQRTVVLLITWAELTYDEVAAALGVPEGTVRSRMNRARTRLRAALASGSDASGH